MNAFDLQDLNTKKVALVRRGANKKRFAMRKKDEESSMVDVDTDLSEMVKAIIDMPVEGEVEKMHGLSQYGVDLNAMDPKIQAILQAIMRLLGNTEGELPDDMMRFLTNYGSPTTQNTEYMKMDASKALEQVEGLSDVAKAQVEEVLKAQMDTMREDLKKAQDDRDAILKLFQDEKDKSLSRAFVTKAEKEYADLPAEAEEVGAILKSVHDVSPELCSKIEDLFARIVPLVAKSEVYSQIGHSRRVETGAWAQAMQQAENIAKNGEKKLTKEQAFTQLLKSDPSMLAKIEQEDRLISQARR